MDLVEIFEICGVFTKDFAFVSIFCREKDLGLGTVREEMLLGVFGLLIGGADLIKEFSFLVDVSSSLPKKEGLLIFPGIFLLFLPIF